MSSTPIFLTVCGTAKSVPGKTKDDGAAQIVSALTQAAEGEQILEDIHQQGEWLRTAAVKTTFNVGKQTVTYTKKQYPDNIEEQQGWLRWKDAPAQR